MPEFAPLVTRSPVMQKDFLPLTSRPVSRPDGYEPKEAADTASDPVTSEDSVLVESEDTAEELVSDDNLDADESVIESSDDQAVVRELTLSASPLTCDHKPVISLHRSGENPDKVTGLRIVCRCGDVIDVSFETDPAKVVSDEIVEGDQSGNEEVPVAAQPVSTGTEIPELAEDSNGDSADVS